MSRERDALIPPTVEEANVSGSQCANDVDYYHSVADPTKGDGR